MAEERSQAPHHCSAKMPPYGSGQEQKAKHVIVKKIYVDVPYNKMRLVWEFVAASVEPISTLIQYHSTNDDDSNPQFYLSNESESQDCYPRFRYISMLLNLIESRISMSHFSIEETNTMTKQHREETFYRH